ncbi:hypothetical protein GIB67_025275 [Kingdonia uniflora]|uniref:Nucleoside phosphorylase domain-containing protein n=1 Tax=Kingdonia uniflora TaxID=39325 RepID=A0A7J7NB09_9MAGN|nr:hypothetical protein GIB67_025275 [Kingdonia uniflora]
MDFLGRRFRIGNLINRRVIMVMTGLGMLNAGIATEILLSLFNVNGVIHFGIAGNANPNLQIGDVVIPKYWAHTGLLNWQRYGDTPDNLLSLEGNGDYTRKLGYLQFSDYSSDHRKNDNSSKNLLNRVWYQPEETFLTNGVAEERSHAFWVPVNNHFYEVAKIMEGATLSNCWEKHCLSKAPIVAMVDRGSSSNIFVDNAAYRKFLSAKFNVTPIDMESAAVALVCHQQRIPFIAFRALSDLAGGGPFQSNEADIFAPLAAENAVKVVFRFIALLSR